jgi:GxxExxY protein
METTLIYQELTSRILRAYYNVYNELGYGFLEKVYENAMLIELRDLGLKCEKQQKHQVFYKNQDVGEYFSDIIVEDKVIIELKAVKEVLEEHQNQLLNYLKATKIEVGLLLNFGTKPQHFRRIYENKFK